MTETIDQIFEKLDGELVYAVPKRAEKLRIKIDGGEDRVYDLVDATPDDYAAIAEQFEDYRSGRNRGTDDLSKILGLYLGVDGAARFLSTEGLGTTTDVIHGLIQRSVIAKQQEK